MACKFRFCTGPKWETVTDWRSLTVQSIYSVHCGRQAKLMRPKRMNESIENRRLSFLEITGTYELIIGWSLGILKRWKSDGEVCQLSRHGRYIPLANREEHCWILFVLSFGGNGFIYRACICTKNQLVSLAIVPIGKMFAPFYRSLSFDWNMCNCATQLDCSCGLIRIDKIPFSHCRLDWAVCTIGKTLGPFCLIREQGMWARAGRNFIEERSSVGFTIENWNFRDYWDYDGRTQISWEWIEHS